jgi:hypothetical protein
MYILTRQFAEVRFFELGAYKDWLYNKMFELAGWQKRGMAKPAEHLKCFSIHEHLKNY